jgi:2-amino-4-hydroxy-6-hydroxymethyldihydropteridine diphosphokinase
MMDRVLVSIGSNIGDRLDFLQKAVDELGKVSGVTLRTVSSVYETEPVGKKDQPNFFNAALELASSIPAAQVLTALKEIERKVGRTPSVRWGPREIDLDLIYVGGLIAEEGRLVLPHREVANRRFVLTPLAEIAPEFVDPVRKVTLKDLLDSCSDSNSVVRISPTINLPSAEN